MEILRGLHRSRGGFVRIDSCMPGGSRHGPCGIWVGSVVVFLDRVIGGSVGGAIGVGALLDRLNQAGMGLKGWSK